MTKWNGNVGNVMRIRRRRRLNRAAYPIRSGQTVYPYVLSKNAVNYQ
jgi:hypothetical protein